MMSTYAESPLNQQLVELFDMKKAKVRQQSLLNQQAGEAQKDIRLLTLMFRDGIPDIDVQISENEKLRWDSRSLSLLYVKENRANIIDATSREVQIKIRPYLTEMVNKAKSLYL